MVSASASRLTPRSSYRSWFNGVPSWSSVGWSGGSCLVKDPGDVASDGPDRRHGPGIVHPGRADDAERGQRLVPGPVAGRHHAGGGQLAVGALVADADRHGVTARRLTEQLEQHDVLL